MSNFLFNLIHGNLKQILQVDTTVNRKLEIPGRKLTNKSQYLKHDFPHLTKYPFTVKIIIVFV